MTERKLSGDTYHQIETHRKYGINAERNQKSLQKGGDVPGLHHYLNNDIRSDHHTESDQISAKDFLFFNINFIHTISHFLHDFLTKYTCRLHEKNDDQNRKHDCIRKL